MKTSLNKLLALFFFIVIVVIAEIAYVSGQKQNKIDERLAALEKSLSEIKNSQVPKPQFDGLVEKSKESKQQIDTLLEAYAKLQNKPPEIIRQEIIKEKSQDELLTEAVAKTTPAVVSIVISKDVPKLEIVYINPFGDDPFFQDFDIRVPRYRQKGTEEKKIGAGTGFLVNENGYIVTNRHVVEDTEAKYTVLLSDGTQKPAVILYKDAAIDVAIIKVEGSGYAHIDPGDSGALKLGQAVFAIGNALGEYNNSVSTGIISGLNRDIESSGETLKGVIQTDAAINPGNSGGPLTALDGKVIGVNVATIIGSNNISFSIPINKVKEIINSVVK